MAQDEELGVLGTVGPGEQGEPAEHAQYGQVRELWCHEALKVPDCMAPTSPMPNLPFLHQGQETRSAAVTGLSAPTP